MVALRQRGGLLLGFLALMACSSDHSELGRKPDAIAATTSAGAGGDAGSMVSSTTGGGGAGAGSPVEPEVATELTLVNGIADANSVSFCFRGDPDSAASVLPWPSAAGVPFAHAAKVDIAALGLKGHDVEVQAVVGSMVALAGKTCAALEAVPNVQLRTLGLVPSSVFDEPRRLLLVASGCVGGETHAGADATLVCGQAYAPEKPTAGLVAGYLSGLGSPMALRLQFVQGVLAMATPASLGVAPGVAGALVQNVLSNWTFGAIRPNPPYDALALLDLVDPPEARLVISSSKGSGDVSFADAFQNGALKTATLQNGDGLAFIAVGAPPGVPSGSWWHAFTFVALRTPN